MRWARGDCFFCGLVSGSHKWPLCHIAHCVPRSVMLVYDVSEKATGYYKCTQCDKPAIVVVQSDEGSAPAHPLCIEHYSILTAAQHTRFAMSASMENNALANIESLSGGLVRHERIFIPMPPRPLHMSYLHIENSGTIGVVNTGNVQKIEVALHQLNEAGNDHLKEALSQMTNAVLAARHELSSSVTEELLENLAFVSTQATTGPANRQRGMIRGALAGIRELVGGVKTSAETVAAVVSAWKAAEPVLRAALGL